MQLHTKKKKVNVYSLAAKEATTIQGKYKKTQELTRYAHLICFLSLSVVTNQYSAALNLYLQAGAVCSDFFTKAVPPDVYTDQVDHSTEH